MLNSILSDPNNEPHRRARGKRTPNLLLGPFYPLFPSTGPTGVLWSAGQCERGAPPQAVEISGRVTNLAGLPVCDAMVEVWQADELGRYRHPSAPGPAPEDPGFVGYGAIRTDALGSYRFRTLKPGAYAAGGECRAPHLHFQVTGAHDRLVTQMFFPDEALNLDDRWYRAASRAEQLVARCVSANREDLLLSWDIVLSTG